MTKLNCDVTSCANNEENCCCRPDIKVAGKKAVDCQGTCCSSFYKSDGSPNNSVSFNSPNSVLSVLCDAKNCIHYDDHICSADNICIGGANSAEDRSQTECTSFRSCK